MKVIDLIQDIEDILETAGGFPADRQSYGRSGGDQRYPQGNQAGTAGGDSAGAVDQERTPAYSRRRKSGVTTGYQRSQ